MLERYINFMLIAVTIIFLTIMCAGVLSVFAQSDIKIYWTYDDTNVTDLAGFNLYENDTNIPEIKIDNIKAKINSVARSYTLLSIPDGKYYWYLTAYDDSNNESGPSNMVFLETDTKAPPPPVNLRLNN